MREAYLFLTSAFGMVGVAAAAAIFWRRISGLQWKWLWIGAGLWTIAVPLKVGCALLINQKVIGMLAAKHSKPFVLGVGGLFLGLESALFEIGITFGAVLIWRQLGRDAPRASGIGVGAGAFEALLLGLAVLVSVVSYFCGMPAERELGKVAASTALFWLAMPTERLMAVIGHTTSRTLVLLGTTHCRPAMIVWGGLMFVLTDGVMGAFILTGKLSNLSKWWIELAMLPFALIGIPILRWCWARWPRNDREFSPIPPL